MWYSILMQALTGACFILVAYVLLYFNKSVSDIYARTKGLDNDHAIEEGSNLAVALRKSGLYLGIMLGMYGVISGPSQGLMKDIIDVSVYGLIVSVFFVIARGFNDFVVLGYVDNTKEVKNGNVAVGLVEFCAFIATGIIAMSSMSGQGGNYLTAIGFFVIGQLVLLCVTLFYEWFTPWSVKNEIMDGNVAAGLRLGGLMVAIAISLHGAIAIDFESWGKNLTVLAIDGALAVLFMSLISLSLDRFFFKGTDVGTEIVRDQNVAAIAVVTALQIAGALAISAAVV
jgi:uncharacterized membrane protein YjfL (UPF0719 family)